MWSQYAPSVIAVFVYELQFIHEYCDNMTTNTYIKNSKTHKHLFHTNYKVVSYTRHIYIKFQNK